MSELNFNALSEDIVARNIRKERTRLVEKWEKTKLLNGLKDERNNQAKSNMAQLLENQTAQLLHEASQDSSIKGFQSIAFPIVRRVFGGLIANELVSVQPMSLPSGLLFYLDYTYGTAKAGGGKADWTKGASVYGDQPSLGTYTGTGGQYYLNTSYSARELTGAVAIQGSGTVASWDQLGYDFELSASVANSTIFYSDVSLTSSGFTIGQIDASNYKQFSISGSDALWAGVKGVFRRHNTYNPTTGVVRVFYSASSGLNPAIGITASFVTATGLTVDSTGVVLSPAFESDFGPNAGSEIPEIDIKVQSVAVTAQSRKLKAKWTPELAQDLQAYQNLDAEVELTQILSEYIAIDIDREILSNLLTDGTGAVMYWSRKPGDFVNKLTGLSVTGATFTGNIVDWYSGLLETINDVANTIFRKTLRGKANFLVVSPDVATILESMIVWRPLSVGDPLMTRFSMGIEKVGSLNQSYTVYKDPYFPRNVVLVGYKGNTFLDSGFIYAPYVPILVTPTIFAPEDFTPRKGVMTRYGKRLVKSDFYGKVIIRAMDVI
jgi:hypothetical protein